MFNSAKMLVVFLSMIAVLAGSCEKGEEIYDPGEEGEIDEYEIEVLDPGEGYLENEIKTRYSYPVFSSVIEEKGYRINAGEMGCFKIHDNISGTASNMTVIPCTNPGIDESVAMIYYIESDGEYMITAAEYFKEEDFEISHPLDTEVYEKMLRGEPDGKRTMQLVAQSDKARRYWQCMAKYFAATCVGCIVRCYLTGPGWPVCTTICCSAGAVGSAISCAFSIYGW